MQAHRSTQSQWTFVADAPRYYDLTKKDEDNDKLSHAWFDQPKSQPNLQHTKQSATIEDTHAPISIDLQDDGSTLDYDDQLVNYTADVYFNSPSHRQTITKRRDIKTELSRTRQEETRHLQDDNTMEYTGLDDAPSERAQALTATHTSPQPTSPSLHQPRTSIIMDYVSSKDEWQQQRQQQQDNDDDNDDGYTRIEFPLLGRVIISPKATSVESNSYNTSHHSASRRQTISPILGTASQMHWPTEQQQKSPPSPRWADTETSPLDEKRYKTLDTTHHPISKFQINHNDETIQQSRTDTHSNQSPPQLRKRLYSEEQDENQQRSPLKKRPLLSQQRHMPDPENHSPPSSHVSPLLQLIAQVKAYKRRPPPPQQQALSPLVQLIARVKSYKHRYSPSPIARHSTTWKTESVVDRAKRVMKRARTIDLQLNITGQEQHRRYSKQRRITTTGISTIPSAFKRHDRRLLDSIPPQESRIGNHNDSDTIELLDDEMMDNKQQQQQQHNRSGSVSFISPYLPVALTVPRSPKFSSEKRSRRW